MAKKSNAQWYDYDESGNLVETAAPTDTGDAKLNQQINDAVMQASYVGPDETATSATGTGTATGTTGTGTSLSDGDTTSYINDLYDAQLQSQIAQLEGSFKQNQSSLDAAEAKIDPTYYAARNATAADTAQSQQGWNEYAAATGLNAGTSGQAMLARNNSYQNAMTDINKSEAEARADLELQRMQLAQEYQSAIAEAQSSADAAMTEAQLKDYYYQDEKATTAAANAKTEFANTIGAYADNYMAQIQALQNDGDTSNDWQIPYLQAARNEKIAAQQAAEAEAAQQEFENWLATQKLYSSSGSGGSAGSGSSGDSTKALTYSQAKSLADEGIYTDNVISALKTYGFSDSEISNMYPDYTPPANANWSRSGAVSKMLDDWYSSTTPYEFKSWVQRAIANGDLTDAEYEAWANS